MENNVLIIINQTALPGERSITRSLTLYDMLLESGHKVTLVTSIFNHYDKVRRNAAEFKRNHPDFNVVFIDEPGYEKNVSIKRIISQIIFGKNLTKWFRKNLHQYDAVYMTMPTNEGAEKVGKICNQKAIPYIIDVRDIWPDAMKMFFRTSLGYKLFTFPMKKIADNAYKQADAIIAVSREYLDRALKVNTKSKLNAVVYQGADIDKFDEGKKKYYHLYEKPEGEFWITYIGTLGESYDLYTFIDAIKDLHNKGYKNIKAKILGRGPLESDLKTYCKRRNIEIDFVGFMDYQHMSAFICHSDLMINPIKKNAAQSIVNKISDYFSSGKPTLNGNDQEEMTQLITDYQCGINYEAENKDSLSKAIIKLYSDPKTRKVMGENARKLAEEKFDRKKSYKTIISAIDGLLKN